MTRPDMREKRGKENGKINQGKSTRENQPKYVFTVILAVCFLTSAGILIKMSKLPPINTGLYRLSFGLTSVANANLFANFTPFTVIPVSYFIFKERIPKNFLGGAIVTFVGVVVLLMGKVHPSADTFLGDMLALSASVFYAMFILKVYCLRDRFD